MAPSPSSPPSSDLRAAFEQLARSEAPALYRTARRLARPPTEAGDLVQESLLRAYRTFEHFRPGTNGRAWLFTILYSVAINDAKRHGRRAEIPMDEPGSEGALGPGARVGDEELALLRRIDVSPEVEHALAELAEPFRSAVLLVDVEELTYEEAAGVLACPVGTLRSRLFRGRRLLFTALSAYARRTGLLENR
jgi:RNA polymerase sigma-70 factor, ECF subfamily